MQKLTKRFSRAILAIIATLNFALPLSVPVMVHAGTSEIDQGICAGANLDVTLENCDPQSGDTEASGDRINTIIQTVINIISLVVGVVAVIMIIVGGLRYITSGGDSGNVTGAKNTILYAIVGLVVVALAQLIVRFVINRSTSETNE